MEQSEVILAYDFGGTKIGIALASKNREILCKRQVKSGGIPARQLLPKIIQTGNELISHYKGKKLVGTGVSMCGVVHQNYIDLAPNLPGVSELNIHRMLTEAFHVPVIMDNDVKAATLAELRQGYLKNTDFGMYINFGTGISAGLTAGNQVIHGHDGAAGEIGYLAMNCKDSASFRSGHASFEEFCSGSGIARRYEERTGTPLNAKRIFERSATNPEIHSFVTEICEEISFQVANLATLWNPERIVIGGGMVESYEILHHSIERRLKSYVPYPPELVRSYFQQEASLYGAIELAFS
jgi:glucokinase